MKHEASVTLVLWNVEWATPGSRRGRVILEQIAAQEPDLVCLTEALLGFVPANGHVVTSDPDYGYQASGKRRKVILWSREPWSNVDPLGAAALPRGRFVEATTQTPAGPLLVMGVCIPWRDAHVRTGQRNRRLWEDHLTYLNALAPLTRRTYATPVILAGDFNQRIPPARTPPETVNALAYAIEPFHVATAGTISGLDRPCIDHAALSAGLVAHSVQGLPAEQAGLRLSDHPGLVIRFS